MSLTETTVSK